MNSLLSLVCCAEFLVALLLIPAYSSADLTGNTTNQTTPDSNTLTQNGTTESSQSTTLASSTSRDTTTIGINKATNALTATTTATTIVVLGMDVKKCSTAFMVAGGLITVFIILLISTVVLACKVCSLSRRLKALSSNSDMVSNREYWMGNDKEDKNKSEARETTVLMSDITQTQEEMSNGAAKEEGDKAKEDGQTAGEKEEGGGGVSEEASAAPAAAESPSSPNPQEEAANSEPSNATAAASSSEGKEEPKDGQ